MILYRKTSSLTPTTTVVSLNFLFYPYLKNYINKLQLRLQMRT